MDDLDQFGPVFHHLSFAEAIRRDLLADYQVVVVAVTDDTYRSYAERGQLLTIDSHGIVDARRLASQIALAKAMRDYNLNRVISFHSRVTGASEFAKSFPQVVAWLPDDERPSGSMWARKISGDMSSGERDVLLGHFRSPGDGQRKLLTNARCLAEGVDVPSIDGVAFIDPRRSQIDVVQAVGRAIRQSPSKTLGTIIIPVFVNPDEDPESVLDSSVFEPVWAVLKALRAHDEVLAEELDELRRGLGQRAATRIGLPGKLHLDLPESVGDAFARAFETRIVEETTSSWEASFGVLERLVGRTGSAEIPRDLIDEGIAIGLWVSKQRGRFRKGDLLPQRVHRLEALSGWVWNPREEAWDEGFSHLVRFTKRHGHALVPTKHREDRYKLGQWINSMRNRYQRRELSPQRIAALEALPKWTWDGRQSLWDEGFNRLCAYEQEHGHTRVPKDYRTNGFPLGNWVSSQRRLAATGKLSAERMAQLKSLKGWTWNALDDDWSLGLERLKQFRAREGHALVPQAHIEDGVLLGRWVLIQRQRRFKMTPERVRLLEEVDGWAWDALEAVWFQNYALLCDYVRQEQHSHVPYDAVVDDMKLGIWVWKQRQDGRLGKLRADRRELLEQIPNWEWESNKDTALWERSFQQLQRSPHLFASTGSKTLKGREDRLLREWVARQRQAYHDGTLGSSRAARLAALPGWRGDPDDEEWSQGLAALRAFAEREGHTSPPRSTMVNDFPLGVWIATQRHQFTRGKLPPQHQHDLEAVPGWRWNKATSRSTPDIGSPKPDSWEHGCRALVAFHAEHGHAQVPVTHIEAKFRLGAWVSRQRKSYRDGKLAAEKVHFLESLVGWSWHPKPDAWDHGFSVLRLFVQREGHAIVPRDHVEEGFKLGAWVVEQRTAYNQDRLQPARAQKLEALPLWCWSRRDAWWEEGFTHLQSFYQREKHTRVPRNHVEQGFDLSRWVNNQRNRSRNHSERAERLMQFPDWYWY